MAYQSTTALQRILRLKQRLRIVQGGARAGKTIAILMCLIDRAQSEPGLVLSVVSETLPHLKRGAIRDFLSIMEACGYFQDSRWNRTDFIYRFETGSIIEFFSADSPDKVRGPARDDLFINECNNVAYEVYVQLAIRTRRDIYLDFNPVSEFWVHTELLPKRAADFIKLTYKDNEALSPEIVSEIESRRDNENWWRVYGLGEVGINEGQIYTNWQIVPNVPEARLERYGMDFGYSIDPSAIVAIYHHDGGYILDEVLYRKGMSNSDLAGILKEQPKALVVADSAEPKSIDEIASYLGRGRIIGSVKGQGSVNQGIQLVQDQRISVTQRSTNVIKEYRNYLWKTDKNSEPLNVPAHEFSHSMDAIRYGLADILNPSAYVFRVRSA